MLELLSCLRANGYKTYIATGGSTGFVREYSKQVYGIPPEQVAGTTQAFKYGYDKDQRPILTREPKLVLDNLEAGKIENFWLEYGCRPYAAFGNSSSDDQQMLEYVKAGSGARLSGVVVHDDATREYAYGPAQGLPDTKIGTLSQAMYDMAKKRDWAIIDAAKNSGALALNVLASPFMWVHWRIIRERVAALSLPTMYQFPEMAEEGGLIAYGSNIIQFFRDIVSRQAAELLRGAKVADVPVEQPTTFDLVINLKTAKALGLSIPESFLLRADEVIE
jgi:ABC transporter substrate binding protein